MTAEPNDGVSQACLEALTARADRTELEDIVRAERYRAAVCSDSIPVRFCQTGSTSRDDGGGSGATDDILEPFGEWAARSSVLLPFGRVLYRLARSLGGPILEIGTGAGVSTAFLSSGLRRNSGPARFISIDANEALVHQAREYLRASGYTNIDIRVARQEVYTEALCRQVRPALIHIDSDHTYSSTMGVVQAIIRLRREPIILCLDDIRWSREMEAVWEWVCHDCKYVSAAIDLGLWGVAVVSGRLRRSADVVYAVPPRLLEGIVLDRRIE